MKEQIQTVIEFVIMAMMTVGLLYIEVVVYLVITLKEYVMKCVC